MRFFQILSLALTFACQVSAQTITPEWANHIGNYGLGSVSIVSMQTMANGDLYAGGSSNGTVDLDPSAGYDLQTLTNSKGYNLGFLVHYDSTGAYIEHKTFGSMAYILQVYDMVIDGDGNFIFVGEFRDSCNFEPNVMTYGPSGAFVSYMVKYDANFNFQWVKLFEPSGAMGLDRVAVDADGNIGIGGDFLGTVDFDPDGGVSNLTAANTDVFFGKYDSNGALLWIKQAISTGGDNVGDVVFDADGNFYLGGNYPADVTIDGSGFFSGPYDYFVCVTKFAPDGTYLWNKGIQNSNSSDRMYINSMAIGPTGNVFFTGKYRGQGTVESGMYFSSSSAGTYNFYMVALNGSTGAGIWGKGIYSGASEGQSLVIDDNGNLFISGNFNSTTDMDFSGNVATLTPNIASTYNFFVVSYDANADFRWASSTGAAGTASQVGLDVDGRSWIAGNFSGTGDFDPTAGTDNVTVPTATTFFGRYSATGAHIESYVLKGTGTTRESVNAIKITETDKVVMAGTFKGDVDFDMGPGNMMAFSASDTTTFIAQYDLDGNAEWAIALSGKIYTTGLDVDASGNIYITGFFTGSVNFNPGQQGQQFNSTSNAIFFAKYSNTGSLVYAKSINGTGDDRSNDIKLDLDGNFVITGIFGGAVDFDPSPSTFTLTNPQSLHYAYVAKYALDGTFVNAWRFTANRGQRLGIDSNNGILVTGYLSGVANFNVSGSGGVVYATGGSQDDDHFVASYDETGAFQWAFRLGSAVNNRKYLDLVCEGRDNFYVMCHPGSNFPTDYIDVDPSGTTLNFPANKAFLAKYSTAGSLLWAFSTADANSSNTIDHPQLTTDDNNNVTYASRFVGTVDLDPTPGGTVNVTNDAQGLLIARYSPSGVFLNEQHYDDTKIIRPLTMASRGDQVVVAGDFIDNTNFNLPPLNAPFMSPYTNSTLNGNGFALMGSQSAYVENTVSLEDKEQMNFLQVYPNPNTGLCAIRFDVPQSGQLTVRDAVGRNVLQRSFSNSTIENMDLTSFSNGLYFVEVRTEKGERYQGKVVKE